MRVPCVGAVVSDGNGRVVVVRRGQAPSKGLWSLPGGRVEAGETLAAAVGREVREETGLQVEVHEVIGRIDITHGAVVYDVTDFAATVVGAEAPLAAGDDAVDVRWVTRQQLARLDCSPGLVDTLEGWGGFWRSAQQ
ncbi:MAG: NUDIX domain-containing protein [Propionibacteriales bacterium]|nr:NUDIX domain-containing protein [Propionibacteriales bacterium]